MNDSANGGGGRGFELTEEEYIVKAAESNRTMIASTNGAGRPRAVEMEQAIEVLGMMAVEFWSWQFRNMATERFNISRATAYRLLEELVSQRRIAAMNEERGANQAARYIKLSAGSAVSPSRAAEADEPEELVAEDERRDVKDDIPF